MLNILIQQLAEACAARVEATQMVQRATIKKLDPTLVTAAASGGISGKAMRKLPMKLRRQAVKDKIKLDAVSKLSQNKRAFSAVQAKPAPPAPR